MTESFFFANYLRFDERNSIRISFVPTVLRFAKCMIVQVFILGNLRFEGYIFPNVEAASVKEQSREQAAHSAVSVIERVYAEEVVNERRNGYERL